MAKLEKRERNLLIILGIVVLIGAVDFAINTEDYLGYYSSDQKNVEKKESNIPVQNLKSSQMKNQITYTNWDRDPFYNSSIRVSKTVYRNTVKETTFQLKAISFSEGMSVAMINSQVLKVGDTIEGYKVSKIEPKQVILEKDGQSKILKLQ
ncbi:MAG: hypothetical protein H6627_01980 [Calditrichae bacterium]|nr:hypothetical protein [Calditrichia bacterium]